MVTVPYRIEIGVRSHAGRLIGSDFIVTRDGMILSRHETRKEAELWIEDRLGAEHEDAINAAANNYDDGGVQ